MGGIIDDPRKPIASGQSEHWLCKKQLSVKDAEIAQLRNENEQFERKFSQREAHWINENARLQNENTALRERVAVCIFCRKELTSEVVLMGCQSISNPLPAMTNGVKTHALEAFEFGGNHDPATD